jgi:multiple sugar transport system substrate-binding protein
MKRNCVKYLAVYLVLIMVLISVAACGSKPGGSNSEPDKGTPEAKETPGTDESSAPEETTAPEETAYDFGGREISFITWFTFKADDEPETLQGELRLKRIRDVEQKFNVKIQFKKEVGGGEFYELLTASLIAGDPLGDIMPVQVSNYSAMAQRKLLYPVSDLEHIFDWSDPRWSQDMHEAAKIDGKFYAFHTAYLQAGYMFFFNKEIFDRMGLPDPYELQRNMEWTWDKMLEIAQQAHIENQDGTVDIWGITGIVDFWGWVYSNGGKVVTMEGGRPVFALTDTKAITALQFAQDLIHKHKVYALTPVGEPWDWPVSLFKEGKAAMMFAEQWLWKHLEDMSDDFGVLLPPMGPDAEDYCSLTRGSLYWSFPAGIENVDEVAMVVNALLEPYEEFPDQTVDILYN